MGKPVAPVEQRADTRPISGTRLIREYQGVAHCVRVRENDVEYQGRPKESLSAIARWIETSGRCFKRVRSGANAASAVGG